MAGNTLKQKANGIPVTTEDFNQFKKALTNDVYPRASGIPSDSTAELGTATYKFSFLYSNGLDIPAGALDGAKLTDATFEKQAIEALGQQTSSSTGSFSTTSGTYVDVTNASVTLTTGGRPVMIMVVTDGTANVTDIGSGQTIGGSSTRNFVKLVRDVTDLSVDLYGHPEDGTAGWGTMYRHIDSPSAGTYTYKLQVRAASGGATDSALMSFVKLIAFEI